MSPLAGKRKITSSSPLSGSRLGMGKRSKSNSFGGQLTQRRVSGPRYVLMRYKALGGAIQLSGQDLVACCLGNLSYALLVVLCKVLIEEAGLLEEAVDSPSTIFGRAASGLPSSRAVASAIFALLGNNFGWNIVTG